MPASDQTCMTDTANAASITRQARPPDTLFGQPLPDDRVDEEAEEREQGYQRQHAVTTSAS